MTSLTALTTIHATSSSVYLPPRRRKIVTADKSYASVVKDITNLRQVVQNRKPTRSSGSASLGSWPTPSEVLTYQSKRHKREMRALKSQSRKTTPDSSSTASWRSSPASSSASTAAVSYLAMTSVSLSALPGFAVPLQTPWLASTEDAEIDVLAEEQGSTDEKPSSQSGDGDATSEEELTDEEQDTYSVECTSDEDEDESMAEPRSLSDAEDTACAPDADGVNVVDEKAHTKTPHKPNNNAWRTIAEFFNWSPVPEWEITHAPEPRSDWPAIATFSLFYFDLPAEHNQLWEGDQDDLRDGQFDQRHHAVIEEWMKDFY